MHKHSHYYRSYFFFSGSQTVARKECFSLLGRCSHPHQKTAFLFCFFLGGRLVKRASFYPSFCDLPLKQNLGDTEANSLSCPSKYNSFTHNPLRLKVLCYCYKFQCPGCTQNPWRESLWGGTQAWDVFNIPQVIPTCNEWWGLQDKAVVLQVWPLNQNYLHHLGPSP